MSKIIQIIIGDNKIILNSKIGDVESTKEISSGSLISLFSKIGSSTGILPKNCRCSAIDGEITYYCIESAPKIGPLRINRNGATSTLQDVYHPNNLFIFALFQGQIISSYCVATKEPFVDLDTEIFRSPFGNTYEDGRICWGTNELAQYTPATLDELVQIYYTSYFNGELDDQSFNNIDACVGKFEPKTLRLIGKFSHQFPQFVR